MMKVCAHSSQLAVRLCECCPLLVEATRGGSGSGPVSRAPGLRFFVSPCVNKQIQIQHPGSGRVHVVPSANPPRLSADGTRCDVCPAGLP